jgi:hypothetical protein
VREGARRVVIQAPSRDLLELSVSITQGNSYIQQAVTLIPPPRNVPLSV